MAKAQSKTEFVLSQPAGMPAKEVVAKAKAARMTISDNYVNTIRSNARRKARKGRRVTPSTETATATPAEREFRRLALDMGVKKAEAILSDTKKKVAAIAAGS